MTSNCKAKMCIVEYETIFFYHKDFHNNLTIHNKWDTKSIVVASCNGFDQILYSRTYLVNIIMKGKYLRYEGVDLFPFAHWQEF